MSDENDNNFDKALEAIRAAAHPLASTYDDDGIIKWLRGASVVLLGEATHGTQEFYAMRARLTRALIEEQGFSAVAIEGDWPNVYRVNQYIHGRSADETAEAALGDFERFPTWMWRNLAVADFAGWLREHNMAISAREGRVEFYGLDLYSLHTSMRAVVNYLDKTDPAAAKEARKSYACFDQFGKDTETYAWVSGRKGGRHCEEAVVRELMSLRDKRDELLQGDSLKAKDEFFQAEQNARLARNAERYYRTMMRGRVASWNLRDHHMMETLSELIKHLKETGRPPKVVVWAHNSHVGDARATEMGEQGEVSLGQLVRERYGNEARLVGFTTYSGTVTAATDWDQPAQTEDVREALPESWEALFHRMEMPGFFLPFTPSADVTRTLAERKLQRAIGVVYRPERERWSHYLHTRISKQFDAVVHLDATTAVKPIKNAPDQGGSAENLSAAATDPSSKHMASASRSPDNTSGKHADAPETYPTGV